MIDLQEIVSRLKHVRITYIASKTGLHYNSVRRIMNGQRTNPSIKTVYKLKELADSLDKDKMV